MFTLILTVAMMGQTAPDSPKSDAELRAIAARVHAQMEADRNPYTTGTPRQRPVSAAAGAYSARKAIQRGRVAAMERAEAAAQAQAQAQARKQYERMLPYMMEQQRQQLERMSAIEKNAALHRLAGAAESEARTMQWMLWQQQQRAR